MKILLGQWHSVGYAGTQSWNFTLAGVLREMGHEVSFYVGSRGSMAARCMAEGWHVYSHLMGDRPTADLAIISQPRLFQVCDVCGANPVIETEELTTPEHVHRWKGTPCPGGKTLARNVLPDCKRMYVLHGWLPHDAPLLDGSPYITVSKETHDRLLKKHKMESIQVNQPIDLKRFIPKKPLREKPVATTLATQAADMNVIRLACAQAGVELLDRAPGQTWNVPDLLNEVDIVIGTGRGVAEAMACGRASVVCGKFGSDGYVKSDNWDELLAVNLSGRATMSNPAESLAAELANYDPSIGLWARDTASKTFDPHEVAERILEAV